MESRGGAMAPGLVLIMVLLGAIAAVGNSEICKMRKEDLMSCKPSVTGDNPVHPPARQCCSALRNADFPCLCGYINSFLLRSMGVDSTLALRLPTKCKITPAPKCSS